MTRQVFYTADLIVPDDTDTDVYGEPTEPGYGATLEAGWLDPDWSRWTVYENAEDVRPDTFDNDGDPVIWLVERISDRLGRACGQGGHTFYATDSDDNYVTGVNRSLAAHAQGFTDEELILANELLNV